jgi:2'-5' RNA ligase
MQAALAAAAGPVLLLAQGADAGAKPVPAANFHLTLAFVGSVPVGRLHEVEGAASRFTQFSKIRELPIEIVLDAVEHWRKPQVLVATASTTPGVAVALGESLQRALIEAGFSPDLKPFRVHATIARKVRRVAREYHLDPVRWSFDALHLVESKTQPSGASYRTVKNWVLDKGD